MLLTPFSLRIRVIISVYLLQYRPALSYSNFQSLLSFIHCFLFNPIFSPVNPFNNGGSSSPNQIQTPHDPPSPNFNPNPPPFLHRFLQNPNNRNQRTLQISHRRTSTYLHRYIILRTYEFFP